MRIAILLTLSLATAACSDAVSVDQTADGDTISVSAGDRFTVELESNPSTGFTWVVEKSTGLRSIEETWSGDSDLTGSPGISRFVFEATEAGPGRLEMVYTRVWSDDDTMDRHFVLNVSVTESG